MAASQETQVYLPGDTAWRMNSRLDPMPSWEIASPVKRRKLNDENVHPGREDPVKASVSERRRPRDAFRSAQGDGFLKNRQASPVSAIVHDERERFDSRFCQMLQRKDVRLEHLQTRQYSSAQQRYETKPPSIDQDGFVKPLPPHRKPLSFAYIDTPTPANRIYHLREVDPNRTPHENYSTPPTLALKHPREVSNVDDPFAAASGNHILAHSASSPAPHGFMQESFKLPPLRHDGSPRPVEEECLETLPTGLTQLEPQGQKHNRESGEQAGTAKEATPQRNVSSRSLRYILAPETATSPKGNDRGATPALASLFQSDLDQVEKPWPGLYGNPSSTASRGLMNSVKETSDRQQATAEPMKKKSDSTSFAQRDDLPHSLTAPQKDVSESVNDRASEPAGQASIPKTLQVQDIERALCGTPRPAPTVPLSPTPITAHITRASSLYALCPDELSHVINSILLEDGFVPFVSIRFVRSEVGTYLLPPIDQVERLSERHQQLLAVQTHADEEDEEITRAVTRT